MTKYLLCKRGNDKYVSLFNRKTIKREFEITEWGIITDKPIPEPINSVEGFKVQDKSHDEILKIVSSILAGSR